VPARARERIEVLHCAKVLRTVVAGGDGSGGGSSDSGGSSGDLARLVYRVSEAGIAVFGATPGGGVTTDFHCRRQGSVFITLRPLFFYGLLSPL
jgi:hypothetical protein